VEKDSDAAVQKLEHENTSQSMKEEDEEVIASGKQQQQQQVLIRNENEFSAEDLHGNDIKILSLLNAEEGSNYSFKGIMRKLNIHQQSLARALHRLEDMGLVQRSQSGYRLSKVGERGTATVLGAKISNATAALVPPKGREYMQLLQTYIPVDIKSREIVRALVGKWFRNLRWVGLMESAAGFTLQWTSDDGSFEINLRMVSDYVIIETNAMSKREKLQAMVGSYAIYEQITRILQDRLAPTKNAHVISWNTSQMQYN
jgi:DNA-binding MarR family transcriptional regulator